jgi:hypothetical protein
MRAKLHRNAIERFKCVAQQHEFTLGIKARTLRRARSPGATNFHPPVSCRNIHKRAHTDDPARDVAYGKGQHTALYLQQLSTRNFCGHTVGVRDSGIPQLPELTVARGVAQTCQIVSVQWRQTSITACKGDRTNETHLLLLRAPILRCFIGQLWQDADSAISIASLLLIFRFLKRLGTLIAVPIILFEEWGWRPLARLMQRFASLPFFERMEYAIRRASPYFSLALFLAPIALLFPFKLGALWLISHGQKTLGIIIILLAKLVSTALLGRLFLLTEKQLMTFRWFARSYRWWRSTKDRVLAGVHASSIWKRATAFSKAIREGLARWRK